MMNLLTVTFALFLAVLVVLAALWFLRPFGLRRSPPAHATFLRKAIEVNEQQFNVRELSVAERLAFRSYCVENEGNQLLVCAWLVAQACDEFQPRRWWQRAPDPVEISLRSGCLWLTEIANEILTLSGMMPDEDDDKGNVVSFLDHARPGTVAAAEKH